MFPIVGSKLASGFSNRGEKKKKKKTKLANSGKISFSMYYFWLFFLWLLSEYLAVQSPGTMPMIIFLKFSNLSKQLAP